MKIIHEDVKLDTPVYRFEIDGKGIWTFMTEEVSNAIHKNLAGKLSEEEYKKYKKFEELVIKLMYNKFFKMNIYYDKSGNAAFTENAFNQLNQIKVNTGHGRMSLIDAIEDILYQINPNHKLEIKKISPKNIVFSDDIQVLYESILRESMKVNNMKIINEEIENLEITETTTVVNQPTGVAKEESKTLWDRFMQATEVPEDAPLFGAEDQPVPDEVEEIKVNLNESLFEEVRDNNFPDYVPSEFADTKKIDNTHIVTRWFKGDGKLYVRDLTTNEFVAGGVDTVEEARKLINESLKEDYNWNNVYEVFTSLSSVYWPDEDKIHEEVEKVYSLHKGEPAWDEAWKRWTGTVDESLKEDWDDGWDSDKVAGVKEVCDDIYNLSYELESTVKGAYTHANTYEELGNYVSELGDRLAMAGEELAEMDE